MVDTNNVKIPNGDVSEFIKTLKTVMTDMSEKAKSEPIDNIDKGAFIIAAKDLESILDDYVKRWSDELKSDPNFTADFPALGKKIVIQPGAEITEISADIFSELSKDELIKAAKISEKSLKDIGRADLIQKYKKITGIKSPSVAIKKL